MAGPPLPPVITPNMGWDALDRDKQEAQALQFWSLWSAMTNGEADAPGVGTPAQSPWIKMFDPSQFGGPLPAPMPNAADKLPAGTPPAKMPQPATRPQPGQSTSGIVPSAEGGSANIPPATANPQGPIDFDRALAVLRQAESGNRSIVGPEVTYPSGKVDRPYGFYQIMGANIPAWTKEVLGKAYTPQEFLNDAEAQHAVARAKFTQFANQHSLADAYAIWASGRPLVKSSENKDLVFGTKVKDTVAARMAQYNKGLKMADIPNMLEMPRPTVGDVANPSPFYTDAPPSGQDEFNSRYQEALGFLKSPEWKAAALQMAIAALQPRMPGQSVIGQLANAVGQGAEAAGRAQSIAEEQRRAGVKEDQSQQELDIRRQTAERQDKLATGQLELQKGQLDLQKATLSRMDDQSKLNWQRLALDKERLDKEYARIEATIRAAEGKERVNLLHNAAKMRTDMLKNAQDRLNMLHKEKDKAEYERVQSEIARHQSEVERITGEYEKAMSAVAPGVLPPKPDKAPVTEMPIDNERLLRYYRQNPDKLQEAITTGTLEGGRMVRFKLTDDQKQLIEDAPRVVPRAAGTVGEKTQERVTTGMDVFSTMVGGMPPRRKAQGPDKIREAGGLSDEEWSKLSSQEKAQRRETLSQLLPDKPPVDAPTWQAILESPQARKAAVALYGEKQVAQAERDLTDMAPRRGKAAKREDSLKKALD